LAQAKHGDTVKVHYTAKIKGGTMLKSTLKENPLQFTIGKNQVIKDFEKTVLDMNKGDSKVTTIAGNKIFGPYRKENIIEVDRDKLPKEKFEVGQRIKIPDKQISVKILDYSESKITIDTNHPLSEESLIFTIHLEEVIPSSDK
jgi:peptidylprolyl isomerase